MRTATRLSDVFAKHAFKRTQQNRGKSAINNVAEGNFGENDKWFCQTCKLEKHAVLGRVRWDGEPSPSGQSGD